MKKQVLFFFALLSVCAFGQGVRYDVPPILNSRAVLVPNANISLCPGTATITNSTCSPASTQAFTDITLTTPCATGSPVVLPQTNVCSGVADTLGNAGFWLAPGAYIYCINGASITGKCYNLTVPVGTNLAGHTTLGTIPAGFTDVAIQAAINATPCGGTMHMPLGNYTGTTWNINVPCDMQIIGDGDATNLVMPCAQGATTDMFIVNPTVNIQYLHFADFQVSTASGLACQPGRYAFHFNGATNTIEGVRIEGIIMGGQLGGPFAIFAEGTGAGNGTLRTATIRQNTLYGGISMNPAGDTNVIEGNRLFGIAGTGAKLDFTAQTGASTLIIRSNNMVIPLHIGNLAVSNAIMDNEFETTAGFVGSNSAFVDIDGNSGGNIAQAVTVKRNSFQIVNSIVAHGLRINFANQTNIYDNFFERGVSGGGVFPCDILITANATRTIIGVNAFASGIPVQCNAASTSGMVSDAGTNTTVSTPGLTPGQYSFNTLAIPVWPTGLTPATLTNSGNGGISLTTSSGKLTQFPVVGGVLAQEVAALGSGGAGFDTMWPDSTTHHWLMNNNATTNSLVRGTDAGMAQKAETGTADANVLTYTPPAIATTYAVCATISVSSATAGVISWTLSWTDSNGNAQSNIAMPLFQFGTAAPNTTFTTSAAGNYTGCSTIDVNNAAANIIVKWVGGGTTAAKMSATIERQQ